MDRCRLANSCNLDQLRDRCSLASFTGTRTSATMELKRKQAHPREPTVTGHSVWTFRAGCLGGGHRQSQPAYRSAQASRHRQDAKNGPEFDHPVLAETNANTSMTYDAKRAKNVQRPQIDQYLAPRQRYFGHSGILFPCPTQLPPVSHLLRWHRRISTIVSHEICGQSHHASPVGKPAMILFFAL